jgi:hypothetical protein
MISPSEILAITATARHCAHYGCRKCASRSRWNRRKGWRSRKNPARRATGRK